MKKLIAFILVLTFAFLLVGCFANQEGKRNVCGFRNVTDIKINTIYHWSKCGGL